MPDKERPNLSPDYTAGFTPEQLQEVVGAEIKSIDEFKSLWEQRTAAEKVVEKVPYEFKDDYIKGLVGYYDQNGDVSPYIKNNVDYSKMTPAEVIRLETKRANEGLSDKAIEHLTSLEMKKYTLGDDASEDDKALQEELLGVRTKKFISQLTEEQKKFNAPEKPSVDLEQWADTIKKDSTTKGLVENKKIIFNHGDKSFNLDVPDPNSLVDMTIDNTAFFKIFAQEDGNMDLNKWYKVLAYAQNPDVFEDSLIKHGQSIGTESVVTDLKNNELGRKSANPEEAGSLLQAFAERGRVVKR